jgi:hypothetical protein
VRPDSESGDRSPPCGRDRSPTSVPRGRGRSAGRGFGPRSWHCRLRPDRGGGGGPRRGHRPGADRDGEPAGDPHPDRLPREARTRMVSAGASHRPRAPRRALLRARDELGFRFQPAGRLHRRVRRELRRDPTQSRTRPRAHSRSRHGLRRQ